MVQKKIPHHHKGQWSIQAFLGTTFVQSFFVEQAFAHSPQ